jgi:hypothetical protein
MQLKKKLMNELFEQAGNKAIQLNIAEVKIQQAEQVACVLNVHGNFTFEPYVIAHEHGVMICVVTEQKLTKNQFEEVAGKASLICKEEADRHFTWQNYTAFGIEGFDFQVVLKGLIKNETKSEKTVGSKS